MNYFKYIWLSFSKINLTICEIIFLVLEMQKFIICTTSCPKMCNIKIFDCFITGKIVISYLSYNSYRNLILKFHILFLSIWYYGSFSGDDLSDCLFLSCMMIMLICLIINFYYYRYLFNDINKKSCNSYT